LENFLGKFVLLEDILKFSDDLIKERIKNFKDNYWNWR